MSAYKPLHIAVENVLLSNPSMGEVRAITSAIYQSGFLDGKAEGYREGTEKAFRDWRTTEKNLKEREASNG